MARCARVRAWACHVLHLALSPQASLLQPRPDALYPPGVLGVAAVVPACALVLQHLRVVHQACERNTTTRATVTRARLVSLPPPAFVSLFVIVTL